ncbi:MAG TPA: hypothetical protein VG347_00950 [Verrucomicrobiae bacterium]|nr:hypothetical protein [Verrucomicrobiae bacterium]
MTDVTTITPRSLRQFLAAAPEAFYGWMVGKPLNLVLFCVVAVVAGAGSYGAVMGSWRDPLQAVYTGIKLPLVMLLTTLGNGLLNGMLAPLLGLNLTFRQSFTAVLISFAVTSIVLGALSPVALFIVCNTPPLATGTTMKSPEYAVLQLTLAMFVAVAGVIGNVRLLPLLRQWSGGTGAGLHVLLAWLAVNLFLGSQISWVLRPFIWEANRPVAFLGADCFQGSFFETVYNAVGRLMAS